MLTILKLKDTEGAAVDAGFLGLDIGPKSITKFDEELTGAKTVVWNGPMGVFENPDFQAGTIGVMDAIVKQPGVNQSLVVVTQLPQLSTLVVLTNSHGFLLVVELLWNFLKVKYFQVLQHLLINNNFFVEKILKEDGVTVLFLCIKIRKWEEKYFYCMKVVLLFWFLECK